MTYPNNIIKIEDLCVIEKIVLQIVAIILYKSLI